MMNQRVGLLTGGIGLFLAFLLLPNSVPAAPQRPAHRVLPAIEPSKREPRRLYEKRNYPSPDRKYIARLEHGDGDVWDLTLLDSRSRRRLITTDDVQALIWVPGHPHRLVVATCGAYGKAQLGLWDRGSRWRSLHAVKNPVNECFTLYGVTADGQTLIYGHDANFNADHPGRDPMEKRRELKLPSN
jgi:hypothetical protein